MKKTFKVDQLLEQVNQSLASFSSKEARQGMCSILEHVLHETGNYRGYTYLKEHEVPLNELPGIRFELEDKFENTDEYRRRYH